MILVDSCIWADHLRGEDLELRRLLDEGEVLTHPFVIGELAMGFIRQRKRFFPMVSKLPEAEVAANGEVLEFIERNRLTGLGIGYIDAHLLASTKLTTSSLLWTRDKRLQSTATALSLAYRPILLQ